MSCDNGPNPAPATTPPVIPHQISRIVRTAVYARIVDPTIGFNPLMAYQNWRYQLKPPINMIDITEKSKNFIFGQITAATELPTTSFKFPLVALYTHGITNKTFIKFRQFSGQVVLGLDVWYSWTDSNARQDYETYADAIEEVVVEIVNGFCEPAMWDDTEEARLVGGEWLSADPESADTALVAEIRFRDARRLQAIATYS